MKKIIVLNLVALSTQTLAVCIPARTVVSYPEDMPYVGQYHRIHPSGKYILGSSMGVGSGVGIIDLSSKDEKGNIVAKTVKTPMIDETYPVEGSWNLMASPNHSDGMRYYQFTDILKEQDKSKPVMNDEGHNQWYHSAAELPGSNPNEMKFRTMLYGEKYRDYTVTYDSNGKVAKTTHSDTKRACSNLNPTNDSYRYLRSPILSKDGTEVATQDSSGNAVIYKIKDDNTCELVDSLGYATSKVNFSYPKPGTKGQIVFRGSANIMVNGVPTYMQGIFMYDRDTKETRRISSGTDRNASYPGMTEDGRVIYVNIDTREIVIVDPNQLNNDGTVKKDSPTCIQVEEANSAGNAKKIMKGAGKAKSKVNNSTNQD